MGYRKAGRWVVWRISVLLLAVIPVPPVHAATITVMNTNDSGSGSLRQAIADAAPNDAISFAPSVVGTLKLTSAPFIITKNLTIRGPGAKVLTVTREATAVASSIFDVTGAEAVTISGITLANGNAGSGGGIRNGTGTLTLDDVAIRDCFAGSNRGGAGIFNSTGTINISRSTVDGNGTSTTGGGIFNDGGMIYLDRSTVSGNYASNGSGGGIYNNGGMVRLINSTVSGNSAGRSSGPEHGGGIYNTNAGILVLTQSTITDNRLDAGHGQTLGTGGGIYLSGGTATVTNTLIAGNYDRPDLAFPPNDRLPSDVTGSYTSGGNNLIGTTTGSTGFGSNGDLVNVANPGVAAIADNGGLTKTVALLPGSPALDAIPASGGGCPATDERGIPRPQDMACDIGAYEAITAVYVDGRAPAGGSGTATAPVTTITAGANSVQIGGTVQVAAGTYNEKLSLTRPMTITGAGADVTQINGNADGATVAANISSGGTLNLKGFTIRAGGPRNSLNGPDSGGVFLVGGGIMNMTQVVVRENMSGGVTTQSSYGTVGGVYQFLIPTINLLDSTVRDNVGTGVTDNGVVSLTNSTVSGNRATNTTGGIRVFGGTTTVTNSTVSGNISVFEGMTPSYNVGGIELYSGRLMLENATVTANSGGSVGGVAGGDASSMTTPAVAIRGSIIAGNLGRDVDHDFASGGYNLIGRVGMATGFGGTDRTGTDAAPLDPRLAPLETNGGITKTHAPLGGSPAIDAGGATCPVRDQRGIMRPQGMACDIGAFETFAAAPIPPARATIPPTIPPPPAAPPSRPGAPPAPPLSPTPNALPSRR